MCKGLPPAITVFGGLLRKSPRTQEYWEKIAEDKSLILDTGDGYIKPLNILYLSYKHLPIWLKSCFLYLGLFPEDREIEVCDLIKIWVAEGLIRSKIDQSLEEIAKNYTKELVDRNLILVGRLGLDKKLKSCRVHDIVRELCIRTCEKEKYFCVQRDIDGMRHFIFDEPTARLFYPRESQETLPSIVHPLILEGQRTAPIKSRLLRVFVGDTGHLQSYSQLVNLRFLSSYNVSSTSIEYWLHSSIQLFWSLQTLMVGHIIESFDAPCEIWKMAQLRHIEIFGSISLPDPPSPTCEDDVIVLQNLQTLKKVKNFKLSEEVCKRIPNIKELEIDYIIRVRDEARSCYHLHNVVCFNKLEALKLSCFDRWEYEGDLLPKMKLPMLSSSLKDLTLHDCKLLWIDMEMTASLPHLQFLKLGTNVVMGRKWNCVEGGFLSLRHLQIDGCDHLINLSTADSSSFPMLETLSLSYLSKLEEIPSGIGEIPTLERMYVSKCSESATMSAIEIMEEQEGLGNQSLQLTLRFEYETDAEMWRRKIQ